MTTAIANSPAKAPSRPGTSRRGGARDEFMRHLYLNHRPDLLRYVVGRNGGDIHGAEDVVQETLLRAWQHADELSPLRGSVRGWLTRVAGNANIDAHRARKARPVEVSTECGGAAMVQDHADGVVTSIVVRGALRRLRPIHRDVLVDVYYRGRDQKEIADTLGIPIGTVKSRLFYALSALRTLLCTET
jgi:RNA polymerase sigma-70 factor (ECF subfamily)